MTTFYITFGQQSIFRDYYLQILAQTDKDALRLAEKQFKNVSMLYTEKEFIEDDVKSLFPQGILFDINMKSGVIWRPTE